MEEYFPTYRVGLGEKQTHAFHSHLSSGSHKGGLWAEKNPSPIPPRRIHRLTPEHQESWTMGPSGRSLPTNVCTSHLMASFGFFIYKCRAALDHPHDGL